MKANKNLKTINNKYFENYALSDDQTLKLKKVILDILKDVDFVLKKNNIYYSMAYGSALGAARHNGFIPWDDDIDIYMFRKDLPCLRKYLDENFPGKYSVSLPGKVKRDPCRFAKVMLNNTTYVEIEYAGLPWPKKYWRGISIDVFILDFVPKSKFLRSLKSFANKICCIAATGGRDFKYPSEPILKQCSINKDLKSFYNKRRFIGFCFSFLTIRTWVKISASILSYHKKTDFVTSGHASFSYKQHMFPTEMFLDTIEMPFENLSVTVVKNFDLYLETLYKNWRIPIEASKREKHILYDIDFGEYDK